MRSFKQAAWESAKAALSAAAFCLFAEALFALVIKAAAPSVLVITAVNWAIKCLASFAFSLAFVRPPRALFKGMGAGVLTVLLTMLLFAAMGGGFFLNAFFPLELLLVALFGGMGALLGGKLRKE